MADFEAISETGFIHYFYGDAINGSAYSEVAAPRQWTEYHTENSEVSYYLILRSQSRALLARICMDGCYRHTGSSCQSAFPITWFHVYFCLCFCRVCVLMIYMHMFIFFGVRKHCMRVPRHLLDGQCRYSTPQTTHTITTALLQGRKYCVCRISDLVQHAGNCTPQYPHPPGSG